MYADYKEQKVGLTILDVTYRNYIAKIISFKNQGTATSSCISLINELCPREKKEENNNSFS